MVENLFLQILNMTFTASIAILVVLLARLALRRAPKIFSFALWAVVLFRLLCPVSFQSLFSVMPVREPFSPEIIYMEQPVSDTGVTIIDQAIGSVLPPAAPQASVNPMQIWLWIGGIVWLCGIAIMLGYGLFSLLRLKSQLKTAVHWRDQIWISDQTHTAFILGFFRPRIYLPQGLEEDQRHLILLHEQTHLKRLDHLTRLAAFGALCLHWFNPLVWVAFHLSARDMEMSCDEAVIKALGSQAKKTYSSSLLTLASGRHFAVSSPLSFGEGDTKGRVLNVLHYRKPAFWVILLAAVAVAAAAFGLITDPPKEPSDYSDEQTVQGMILELEPENKTMMVEGTEPNSAIGDQCLVSWEGDPFFTLDEQGKSIPLTVSQLSAGDYVSMTIGPVMESYPTMTTASSIQLLPSPEQSLAQNLWQARVDYIGSAPDVGNLIGLLPVLEGLKYDHFELETSQEPYGVRICYQADSESAARYRQPEQQTSFEKNALILLALIDNGGQVEFILEGDSTPLTLSYSRQWAEQLVGGDIKTWGESAEQVRQLLELPLSTSSSETGVSSDNIQGGSSSFGIVFPAYDQRTEYNSAIFDIEPFQLLIQFPEGFTVAPRGQNDVAFPLTGTWTPLGIYDQRALM